jgi:hypothetical protein
MMVLCNSGREDVATTAAGMETPIKAPPHIYNQTTELNL